MLFQAKADVVLMFSYIMSSYTEMYLVKLILK